jgi:hypothetical protein
MNRHRSGTTIIEVIGMIGLLLVIGATSHRSLGNLTRASHENQLCRTHRLEIGRLAKAIRRDGRELASVQTEGNLIVFSNGNRQVRYQWNDQDSVVMRQVLVGGEHHAADRFRFKSGTQVAVDVSELTDQSRLLSVEMRDRKGSPDLPKFRIEVEL